MSLNETFLTLYMTVNWHREFAVNFATFLKVCRDFFSLLHCDFRTALLNRFATFGAGAPSLKNTKFTKMRRFKKKNVFPEGPPRMFPRVSWLSTGPPTSECWYTFFSAIRPLNDLYRLFVHTVLNDCIVRYRVFTRSSKLPANVFKKHVFLDVSWKFAGRLLDRVNTPLS